MDDTIAHEHGSFGCSKDIYEVVIDDHHVSKTRRTCGNCGLWMNYIAILAPSTWIRCLRQKREERREAGTVARGRSHTII